MLIVFDLDDTLIDTSGSITPRKLEELAEFLRSRGIGATYPELAALNENCINSKEAIRQALERYGAPGLFEEALRRYTEPLPNGFPLRTTPHAKKVLTALREKGHLLAVVTAGKQETQLQKLKIAGLELSMFSKIAVSEDSMKGPIYRDLLREFLESCLVVGDRVPSDLAPARELGCRTAHMRWGRGLRSPRESWVDYSIQELSELLEWV